MKKIIIYTDGACSYNPGPGGWGVVLIYGEKQKQLSGFEENTTNNRMEIMAVIKALESLKQPCEVDLYTDSAYVSNAFLQDWVSNWVKNNWRGSDKKQVKNKELWQKLLSLTEIHKVTFHKVKGHADNEFNNLCDKLATGEIEKNKKTCD